MLVALVRFADDGWLNLAHRGNATELPPMLTLHTLGSLDLRTDSGQSVGAVLAQTKRLALLIYLAAARAEYRRRDRLLALFWPDLDEAHGRDSLNQALRFLRQSLPPDVIITRGVDDVGVNPNCLWCDAVAFHDALAAGRPADALSVYGGDFLAGFFVDDAAGFEEWTETERAMLRESAARGARQLADAHENAGAHTLAVSWARRATSLAPDDERLFRHLLILLEQAGDRAGALRAYEDFAGRLRAEYACEPAPETVQLMDRLRAGALAAVEIEPPRPVEFDGTNSASADREGLGGRYVVERELGAGGMATVYLARDRKHDRHVAVKVLNPEISAAFARERFLREIRIAARLQHPNIVPLFDSGEADGRLYYVMPYVDGETLRERVAGLGRLSIESVLHVLAEVSAALQYAHERGVVHRDIKPANILVAGDRAAVSDFGIARAIFAAVTDAGASGTADTLTQFGTSLGTPAYMAPEQAAGEPTVDHRADLYSLGVVAYELLAGRPPFTGSTPQQVWAAHLRDSPAALSTHRSDVPPWLDRLVMRCLAKNPEDRWQSAADLRAAVIGAGVKAGTAEAAAAAPAASPTTAGAPDRPVTARQSRGLAHRRGLLTGAALAIAVLAGIGAATRFWLDGPRAEPNASLWRIAVFPFTVHGAPESQWMGSAAMDLLSGSIDGVGDLRRVHPRTLLARMRRDGVPTDRVELEQAHRVSVSLGARRFILASATPAAGRVRVSVSLFDAQRGSEPVADANEEGSVDSLSSIITAVTRRLFANQPVGGGTRLARIGSYAFANHVAERAYLEGEAALRRGVYDTAVVAFKRALAADPTIALAWYRLDVASGMGGAPATPGAMDSAWKYRDRLHERDRLLIDAVYAHERAEFHRAEQLSLRLVELYPDHVEGWWNLGATRAWFAGQMGRSPSQARAALERALSLDPDDRETLHMLNLVALYERRYAEAESLATVRMQPPVLWRGTSSPLAR